MMIEPSMLESEVKKSGECELENQSLLSLLETMQ